MPWPNWLLPVAFLLLLLFTVALWALIRARDFSHVDAPVRLAFTLLLVVFNLTCVGLKVLHYNPYAETKKLADTTLVDATERERQAIDTATAKIAEHATAAHALRTAVGRLDAQARHKLDAAWEAILRDRDGHGLTGELAPEFAVEGMSRFDKVQGPPIKGDSLEKLAKLADELEPGEARTRLFLVLKRKRKSA